MSPSEKLTIAGNAAAVLESMGFTSAGRLRDGVVTLTAWLVVDGRPLTHVHIVDDTTASPEVLAHLCAAKFREEHGLAQTS